MPLTTVDAGLLSSQSQQTWRNRIINGAMVIDQRNNGASVSLISGGGNTFSADRWYVENFTDGTATIQQISDAPTGFANSIRYTVTATDSSLASDQSAFVQQRIEGFNSADLMFGTANAATVTVSFWVKSSVTGTFGGALANNAYNRGYPFTYTISSANTWEQKTVIITGDTTGTWVGSTNGIGLRVTFALAAGSARVSTAGAWAAYVGLGATGATNLMATNGATWQVTGVQLEKGSTATSFDYRPYGTELAMCQRYCFTAPLANSDSVGFGYTNTTTSIRFHIAHAVTMRASPSFTGQNASSIQYQVPGGASGAASALSAASLGPTGSAIDMTVSSVTAGQPARIWGVNVSGSYPCLIMSAEL
jgi:hypothetical protein